MSIIITGNECDFIGLARSTYASGDDIVDLLDKQKKLNRNDRKSYNKILKGYLGDIEDYLWQALERDYPKFRYRSSSTTIAVDYRTDPTIIYINPGEVYKIKSWGHNEYYEALDTINRLQSQMIANDTKLDRRWQDDWKRLNKQINIIFERNCRKIIKEPRPQPVIIECPATPPCPPNPPGPGFINWPPIPVAVYPQWDEKDKRNWSVTGWTTYGSPIPGQCGILPYDAPTIVKIDGRDFIYYKPTNVKVATKILWLFHGSGGDATSWFVQYEKVKYIKKFLDAGYMVCAYESYNRVNKKWSITPNLNTNRDISGLKACQDHLIKNNLVTVVYPSLSPPIYNPYTGVYKYPEYKAVIGARQFGVGMSRGGDMVTYAAAEMNLNSVVVHNAEGQASAIKGATYSAATLWMISANDSTGSNINADALANYNWLVTNKAGLAGGFYSQVATKITSAMFDDIPNISTPVAEAIVTGLTSSGFIDGSGNVTSKFTSASRTVRELYNDNTIPGIIALAFGADSATYNKYVNDIMDQIRIAFSIHEFSGWQRSIVSSTLTYTDRDLAFFQS